ncbi:MBL fold metallo-hydrolase [Natranaerobius thermophilus]|uniref:Beta-lactamase domain protein n=1 Tax=Natranaerobius thermophilus (strain ATCC BAA-1301 / DSM 18059 / JW/NM-WN-LF) TaxID=457570 RepID=B2A3L4_NATTJ|nr:MBL fold metallo-hydrolase [Natranaerobius thermophilus]ACB86443.1 beta-lactamase domain protein [Natranaerobius thermophilus JW/NM-WN-LF]
MEVAVLASGSNGNSIYIEYYDTKLLIDAGLSGKAIERKMANVNKDPKELTGIIVTHEHRDHVKGVGVLARRFNIPVYATRDTWPLLPSIIGTVPEKSEKELPKQGLYIQDLYIEPFPVSHDAVDPVGLCLYTPEKKLGIATDSGIFTPPMFKKLTNCHGLILESNHDPDLLSRSSYPEYLKKRIRSRKGHISNNTLVHCLPNLINENLRWLILGHLSENNNCPDLVRNFVSNSLSKIGQDMGIDVPFKVAERSGPPITFTL